MTNKRLNNVLSKIAIAGSLTAIVGFLWILFVPWSGLPPAPSPIAIAMMIWGLSANLPFLAVGIYGPDKMPPGGAGRT